MNLFFYESHGKEKVKSLMEEGMRSQAVRQTRHARPSILTRLSKLALMLIGILGALGILLR